MFPIVISSLQMTDEVEVVERKGIGHPTPSAMRLRKRSHAICVGNINDGLVKFFTTTSTRRCCAAVALRGVWRWQCNGPNQHLSRRASDS